jgi:hypothetical protein
MCDCYIDTCCKCKELLEIHLGDFNTARSEIAVYCKRHIPNSNLVWVFSWQDEETGRNVKMGIKPLTRNAYENMGDNFPNISEDFILMRKGQEILK